MSVLTLREARADDSRMLWQWRNAADVRATAFESAPIAWEDHVAWFERKLNDPDTYIFVAEDEGGPVGQVRFEREATKVEVDVIVRDEARGRGYGTEIIRLGTSAIFDTAPVETIHAYIKESNAASIRAFRKAGFESSVNTEIQGEPVVHLVRDRPRDPRCTDTFVVVGSKPWNRRLYDERLSCLPGEWHFVGTPEDLEASRLETLSPRYIFFLHWSERVADEIVKRFECVCFHMTDVPYGRGGSPLQNLIARGHARTKLTALRMVGELDAGPVYAKEDLCLQGGAEEIYMRAGQLSAEMIERIATEEPDPLPQEGDPVVFKRRKPSDSALPGEGSLLRLHDSIRMLDADGYPAAFIEHGDFRLEFSRSVLYDGRIVADVTITKTRQDHQ